MSCSTLGVLLAGLLFGRFGPVGGEALQVRVQVQVLRVQVLRVQVLRVQVQGQVQVHGQEQEQVQVQVQVQVQPISAEHPLESQGLDGDLQPAPHGLLTGPLA